MNRDALFTDQTETIYQTFIRSDKKKRHSEKIKLSDRKLIRKIHNLETLVKNKKQIKSFVFSLF